jgi:hypothetical protein
MIHSIVLSSTDSPPRIGRDANGASTDAPHADVRWTASVLDRPT